MKSNIFLPKTLKVGYQNRQDTYTGKLAYVIYYDNKNKLRKETSWNSWRDNKIESEEFENVPTDGFVINKSAGGVENSWSSWNTRKSYIRIYDPRGIEFEITVSNLLYILENTNSIVGKGLEGEFVYGWDGKDIALIPVASPDYKEIKKFSDLSSKTTNFKGKDMIVGATYLDKNNEEVVYMGRFDKHDCETEYYSYNSNREFKESDFKFSNKGKYYYFRDVKDSWRKHYQLKSIGKNIIDCVSEECTEKYSEYFEELKKLSEYEPYDRFEKTHLTEADFQKYIDDNINDTSYRYQNGVNLFTQSNTYDCLKLKQDNRDKNGHYKVQPIFIKNIRDDGYYRHRWTEVEVNIKEYIGDNKPFKVFRYNKFNDKIEVK